MRVDVLTLFPSMFSPLSESIIGRAREKGLIQLVLHNIRDHTSDKHRTADDTPYGGGAGMVLKAEPIFDALKSIRKENKGGRVIMMSAGGRRLDNEKAKQLSKEEGLIIICGHYEGVDERVVEKYVDEEISIGDYVVSGGELAAMVLIDSVARFIPGVLGNDTSVLIESFSDGLLEGPHYTRPETVEGMKVPDVLLSGNHKEIRKWKRKRSLEKTLFVDPSLLGKAKMDAEDRRLLGEIIRGGEK